MKKRDPLVKILIGIAVLAVLGFFAYSLQQYYHEGTESGVVVCDNQGQNCMLSMHIHTNLELTVCGEKLRLPLETGSVEGPHTHKERNRIHIETVFPFDPATQQITDTSKLTLGAAFDAVGTRFTSTCLGDKCNGDPCDGIPGQLTMKVNGQQDSRFRDYLWQDEDTIELTFG